MRDTADPGAKSRAEETSAKSVLASLQSQFMASTPVISSTSEHGKISPAGMPAVSVSESKTTSTSAAVDVKVAAARVGGLGTKPAGNASHGLSVGEALGSDGAVDNL